MNIPVCSFQTIMNAKLNHTNFFTNLYNFHIKFKVFQKLHFLSNLSCKPIKKLSQHWCNLKSFFPNANSKNFWFNDFLIFPLNWYFFMISCISLLSVCISAIESVSNDAYLKRFLSFSHTLFFIPFILHCMQKIFIYTREKKRQRWKSGKRKVS